MFSPISELENANTFEHTFRLRMATRSLTKRFVELRNGAKANRNLGVSRGDDTGDEIGESGLLRVRLCLVFHTTTLFPKIYLT